MSILLPREHGGCWNVQHFSDEEVKFTLEKNEDWIQIRFITAEKASFYANKSTGKKRKTYLVKNDFVCIHKMEDNWLWGTFYGKKIVKGWIRIADVNTL